MFNLIPSKRVYRSITVDMTKPLSNGLFTVVRTKYGVYTGDFAECKGDSTLRQSEQQQAAFNAQMMDIFKKQYAQQSSVLNFLTNKLEPMIKNPTGYSPEAETAMRTGATDQLSTAYQNAQRTLQNNLNQRNLGSDLPSGTSAQLEQALLQSEATDKANAQNTITLNNENLKQSNLWNAMNVLSGNVASQFNPLGYASNATQGGDVVANLGNAYKQSQKGFFSNLAESFGSTLGQTLGGGNGQSLAALGTLACWIAAASFNEDFFTGVKTNMVRNWLWNTWSKHWYAKPVLALYQRYGRWVARQPILVSLLKPLFTRALREAQKEN